MDINKTFENNTTFLTVSGRVDTTTTPMLEIEIKERQIGGLGIFMVKKNMDDVRYEYLDGHNILTLKKGLLLT